MLGLFGKKYKCATCGASFKSQDELTNHSKMHMQTSSQAGSFRCQACGASFNSQMELSQHSQKVHHM